METSHVTQHAGSFGRVTRVMLLGLDLKVCLTSTVKRKQHIVQVNRVKGITGIKTAKQRKLLSVYYLSAKAVGHEIMWVP